MRVVLQRVSSATVQVDEQVIGKIGAGFVLLVGVEDSDTLEDVQYLARKITNMRIFEDKEGKMNLSLNQVNGQILSISQFTLHASTKKGNRPSFTRAGSPDYAEKLYEKLNDHLRQEGLKVETGSFGADMMVELVNDGPVTIWMDSKQKEY